MEIMNMRTIYWLVFLGFTVLFTIACKKDNANNIYYQVVNRTLINNEQDTLLGNCNPYIIALIPSTKSAILYHFGTLLGSTCESSIVVNSSTPPSALLTVNTLISSNSTFNTLDTISLNDFMGKGNMYIGIMQSIYDESGSSLILDKYYSWVEINYNTGGDTLKVISFAENNNVGNAIKAGQKN